MRPAASRTSAVLLSAALGTASCYAGLPEGEGGTAVTAGGESTGSGDPGPGSTGGEPPAPAKVPAPTIRRLTASEFAHSVRDLLGPVTLSAVEADSHQDGFFAVGAARVALSPAGVAKYEAALDAATAEAFADPARVAEIVSCVPALPDDLACLRDALATFGRRAWRRPLTAPELDRHLAVASEIAAETGDGVVGLRHGIWGLLQSPHFLYRVEIGEASADDGGRARFSSYELASRLAFTLWNTLPDEELLDAAERDELASAGGLAIQAQRMLADPRARQGVENFINELYSLWSLDEKIKDETVFPDWTPTLQAVLRDDLLARVGEVVFTAPGDFFSLYDDTRVFVDNELARIYGLPEVEPDLFRAAQLPADGARRGLIGSAAILAMNALPARTSATERGQFIADALLCRSVPPPPPNVDTNLDDEGMSDPGPKTLREKLERHRVDPACSGCHSITDPLGLALEHFDAIGRHRETDQGLVIDASGELDGLPFADAAELALRLREHPEAPTCLVRKLHTYAAGRLPFGAESDMLATVEDALASEGNRFDRLLLALVTHDDFRFAHPEGTVLAPDPGEMP